MKNGKMVIETFRQDFEIKEGIDLFLVDSNGGNITGKLPPAKDFANGVINIKALGGQGDIRILPADDELIDDINDYVFGEKWDSISIVAADDGWVLI